MRKGQRVPLFLCVARVAGLSAPSYPLFGQVVELEIQLDELKELYNNVIRNSNSKAQQKKMAFLERNLEQLTLVQKQVGVDPLRRVSMDEARLHFILTHAIKSPNLAGGPKHRAEEGSWDRGTKTIGEERANPELGSPPARRRPTTGCAELEVRSTAERCTGAS